MEFEVVDRYGNTFINTPPPHPQFKNGIKHDNLQFCLHRLFLLQSLDKGLECYINND